MSVLCVHIYICTGICSKSYICIFSYSYTNILRYIDRYIHAYIPLIKPRLATCSSWAAGLALLD